MYADISTLVQLEMCTQLTSDKQRKFENIFASKYNYIINSSQISRGEEILYDTLSQLAGV